MNTKKTRTSMKWWMVTMLAVMMTACGANNKNVPKAYQGTYQDSSNNKLVLTSSQATLQIDGKTLSGATAPITYNNLLQGKPGFYIYQENKQDKLLDVYWVTPDLSTKNEAGGIVYYTTDIVYLQIDLNQKGPVQALTIVHANNGTVMLDTQSKRWQAGWPAHSTETTLIRAGAKSNLMQNLAPSVAPGAALN